MQPTNRNLAQVLVAMYGAKSPATRARAENMIFDEQIDPARQGPYEADFAPPLPDYRSFHAAHKRYLDAHVFTDLPETFTAANTAATIDTTPISGKYLLRIECLGWTLGNLAMGDVDQFIHILHVYRKDVKDPHMTIKMAQRALQKVCDSLNANPRARSPRFATFEDCVTDDVNAPDWAERLRDRLGLSHYPDAEKYNPHPVALMRYPISEIAAQAQRLGLSAAATIPTVLDALPRSVFHPTPRGMDRGYALNLAGEDDYEKLVPEILHPRITYKPSHFLKIGTISSKGDLRPSRLTQLRDGHRDCLRVLCCRDDYGKVTLP